MAQFTKGPWVAVGAWVEHPSDNVADICTCDPDALGQGHLVKNYDTVYANAQLIACAPDLLTALKAMVAADPHKYRDSHKAADDVIAKAEGG